jgi:dihydrodipicolinate synthase/N-acetylneuraminate lyase
MARLTADEIRGIWAGVTMVWDEDMAFDDTTYALNVQRAIEAGAHGIYTTGSTGEFYAIEYEEFKQMVDICAGKCSAAGMPLQIGCCADATAKTIRLLEYAAGKDGVGAAQVNIPYWMELTDRELLQFFKDITTACPGLPLVHYNIPRAKRFLQGADYLKILEVAPALVGVKYTFAGSNFAALQDSMMQTPQLSYFVGENMLVSAMMLGARGCYSSLVATNPRYALDMYARAAAGEWDAALRMQQHASSFFGAAEEFVEERGEGCIDPVFDKGLGVAAGCVLGHQRCRAPYIGWSDETIQAVRAYLQEHYPEFVYPG